MGNPIRLGAHLTLHLSPHLTLHHTWRTRGRARQGLRRHTITTTLIRWSRPMPSTPSTDPYPKLTTAVAALFTDRRKRRLKSRTQGTRWGTGGCCTQGNRRGTLMGSQLCQCHPRWGCESQMLPRDRHRDACGHYRGRRRGLPRAFATNHPPRSPPGATTTCLSPAGRGTSSTTRGKEDAGSPPTRQQAVAMTATCWKWDPETMPLPTMIRKSGCL